MNTILRRVSWPVVLVGLFAPLTIHCGAINKATSAAGLPGVPQCPDMSKIDEVDKFDWVGSYKLQPKAAAQVKAGVGAAIELKALADKVDADLKASCSAIAHDLGDTADYADGQAEGLRGHGRADRRHQGPRWARARRSPSTSPGDPALRSSTSTPTRHCAGGARTCDEWSPALADFQCDGGKLEGTVQRAVQGRLRGQRGGGVLGRVRRLVRRGRERRVRRQLRGQVRRQELERRVRGQVRRQVLGQREGHVQGQVRRGVQAERSGELPGNVHGLVLGHDGGPEVHGHRVKPPSVSAECKAKCDAQVQANVTCTPPHITLRITGAADAKAAAAFQATLEKNLPAVLDTAVGLGKNAQGLVASVKSVVGGVQTVVQSATSDKMRGAALVACVGKPFADVAGAAAAVTGSVTVSVNVQASVKAGS